MCTFHSVFTRSIHEQTTANNTEPDMPAQLLIIGSVILDKGNHTNFLALNILYTNISMNISDSVVALSM